MSIYTKKAGIVFTAVLPLMLIGCGGGGGDSSDDMPQDSIDNGTRYYMVDYDLDNHADKFNIEYMEIYNKKIKIPEPSSTLDEYVLTAKKLYTPTDIPTNTIVLNSLTSWTSTLIGDVKTDVQLEKVNISGKNIFDTVLPGYRNLGFDSEHNYSEGNLLLSAYGKDNFPQGSTCYRFISKKLNQDYFNFETTEEFNQKFEQFDQENSDYVDSLNKHYQPLGLTYRYMSGTWQNIPWTTIYEIDTGINADDSVAIKYQNKTYLAEYNSSTEWTSTKEIKQWQNLLAQVTKDYERTPKLNIEKLKNGCDIYNDTAAQALLRLKLIDWTH